MGDLGRHRQDLIPSQSLDKLLEIYRGKRVFHSANWGGYLTWHGWNLSPASRPGSTIGSTSTGQSRPSVTAVLQAMPGWETLLVSDGVELLCIRRMRPWPAARQSRNWQNLYRRQRRDLSPHPIREPTRNVVSTTSEALAIAMRTIKAAVCGRRKRSIGRSSRSIRGMPTRCT